MKTKLITIIAVTFCKLSLSQTIINLNFDFINPKKFSKNIYGYNEEHMGSNFYENFNGYKNIYNDLGKPIMRFPGGTTANYVNTLTGMAEVWNNATQENITRKDEINVKLNNNGKYPFNSMNYADFVLNTPKAKSNYVVNMSSMTLAENQTILQNIKNTGATINFFELGNELFFGNYSTAFPTVQDYINKAINYSNMIRGIFGQNVKIAVVVPAEFYTNEVFLRSPHSSRLQLWYNALKNETFYDAIAVHLYSSNGMDSSTQVSNFLPYEESYTYALTNSDHKLNSTIIQLQKDFPNKRIWITEYHVGGFKGPQRAYRLRYSHLGGLFCADFMLKLYNYPSIQISNWHSLSQWFSVNSPSGNLAPNNFLPVNKKINQEFFKVFKEPVANCTKYVSTTVNNSHKYQGLDKNAINPDPTLIYNEIDAGTFFNPTTGKGYVILINKKEKQYRINKNNLQQSLNGIIVKFSELTTDNTIVNPLQNESIHPITDILPTSGFYSIKPYSLYKVEFDVSSLSKQTQTLNSRIIIYPNPAQDEINIEDEIEYWEIFDLTGKKILKGFHNNINIQELNKGIYFIKTDKGNSIFVKK